MNEKRKGPHPRRSATAPLPFWERGPGGEGLNPTELGDLPAEWEVVRLGNFVDKKVVRIKNGFPFGGFNQEGRGIPHLRPFNINNNASIDLSSIKYIETDRDLEAYFLQPGDVFFNNTNSEELVGKTTYWNRVGQFVFSNHMTSIRVLDTGKLDPYFLMSYFHQRWREGYFQSLCRRHVNQASISLARIKQIPIPHPPLPEQRRIAHVLNTVQGAIAAQDDLIAAAREVKRSLLRRLFTVGPGPEPAPTRETEIGEVPEHWEVVTVGQVFHIQLGKMLSKAARKGVSPFPYLRNANVQWGYFDLKDLLEMDFNEQERERFQLKHNDILVCEGGEIGRTAIWEGQLSGCYYQKALHRLRPITNNVLPRFFLYYMMLIFLIRSIPIAEGAKSTIAHLPVAKLKMLPFILPPPKEQHHIAHILQTADAKIAAEQDRKGALQALFNSLLQALMTGRWRV